MPKNKVLPLHAAKTLEELIKMADTKFHEHPRIVAKSLTKLLEEAKLHSKNGDEELSYMMYHRYICGYMYIHNHAQYKKDPVYFNGILGNAAGIKTAMSSAETLSSSLEKRYSLLREEEEVTKILRQQELDLKFKEEKVEPERLFSIGVVVPPTSNGSGKSSDNSAPNDNPSKVKPPDEAGTISCRALYNLLIDKNAELVIMDARDSESYAMSCIKHTSSINVPEEIISPGITAHKIEAALPAASRSLWGKRAMVDYVVLVDWDSMGPGKVKHPKIHHLKEAINKWDVKTVLKSEPVILCGGYDSWLNYYPTLTTNAEIMRPETVNSINLREPVLDFEYPDLNEGFVQAPDSNDRSDPDDVGSKHDGLKGGKSLPSFDRSTKPKVPNVLNPVNLNNDPKLSDNLKISSKWESLETAEPDDSPVVPSNSFPSVNRQLKPRIDTIANSFKDVNLNKENEDRTRQMKEMLVRNERYANDRLELEKERLLSEQKIANIRLHREKEAEENMKIELQLQETRLLNKLDDLESQKKTLDTQNSQMKEENENLRRLVEKMTASNQQNEEMRLKVEKVLKKNEERKILDKEVHRLRLERTNKERQRALVQESATPAVSSITRDSASPSKVVNKPSPSIANTHSTQVGADKITTTFAKLKSDGTAGRGMSRSQSFSNISFDSNESSWQDNSRSSKAERIIPSVNRNVKPSVAEVNAASTRDFMPVFGGQGHGLTGLRNLGNTCFMNSVLQSLNHSTALVNYFNNVNYRADISRNNKHAQNGLLVDEFAAVVRALGNGQYRSISAKDFKRVVSNYQSMFAGFDQHDSQEFLTFLIDGLHEDLNKGDSKRASELSKEAETAMNGNLPESVLASKLWKIYNQMNESIIVDLFQGQTRTILMCLHCNKTSVRFDTFRFLSLPIPPGTSKCHLRDCIQLYLKEEKMTGSSKWKCPRCNDYREAVMKIDLWKLPPVLLIHVKRFFYEGVWRKKLQTNIDFPLDGLEFRNFVKGPEQPSNFNLFAVTNHYGTMDGGHYTAYCRNPHYNRWFKFDDHEVNEMSQGDVKSPAAYIMYYTSS